MLVLALALAAFIQPAAANGTTADDRAVMSAVLDGFLNADRDPAFRPDATETNNPTPACSDVNRDTERRLLNGLECTSGFVPIDIAFDAAQRHAARDRRTPWRRRRHSRSGTVPEMFS